MNEEKLRVQELILTLIHCIELDEPLETVFFDYLEGYNPNLFEKMYPLFVSENDFFLAITEGIKHTENDYDEHLFLQLSLCKEGSLDYYDVLEDALNDIETF